MPKPIEIRKERVRLRLTQKKAADIVRVHINTWNAWERGLSRMPESIFEYFKIVSESR